MQCKRYSRFTCFINQDTIGSRFILILLANTLENSVFWQWSGYISAEFGSGISVKRSSKSSTISKKSISVLVNLIVCGCLKAKNPLPLLFTIVTRLFWHHGARNENWCEKICDLPEKLEFVSKVEILLQSRVSKFDKNSILKLCRPHQNSSLLQCEFSNNIF